jgi:hypothetical protein
VAGRKGEIVSRVVSPFPGRQKLYNTGG